MFTRTLQLQQQCYYNTLLKYNDRTAAITGIISQSPHSTATGIQQNYILPQEQQLL